MKKTILAIMLVLAMVLMIGCASTQAVKQQTPNVTESEPTASESPSTADEVQTVVGITTLDMSNPFFIELVEGAQSFADKLLRNFLRLRGSEATNKVSDHLHES